MIYLLCIPLVFQFSMAVDVSAPPTGRKASRYSPPNDVSAVYNLFTVDLCTIEF